MPQTYYGMLTAVGEAKDANAKALGIPLVYADMAVGDGNGVVPIPDPKRTTLVREVRRAPLNSLTRDAVNTNQVIAEQVIPEGVGGWYIRELGLYDADGDLIAIANCPETYKPLLAEGSGRVQTVRLVIIVSSADNVQLKIDPSVILATREYADKKASEVIAAHETSADPHPQYATKAAIQSQAHTAFTTAGAAPDFTLSPRPRIAAYVAGQRFRVKFKAAGNGTSTLNVNALGARSLRQYDANGAKLPAVIAANQLADVEYDGADFVILNPLTPQSYDLSGSFDFYTAVSPGTANVLYSPAITKARGVYLITPYSLAWTYQNDAGSYFMSAFAEFLSGSGTSTQINMTQDGLPSYDRVPFVLRVTSPTATFRFGLKNNGSNPPGRGTVTVENGMTALAFTGIRIG